MLSRKRGIRILKRTLDANESSKDLIIQGPTQSLITKDSEEGRIAENLKKEVLTKDYE